MGLPAGRFGLACKLDIQHCSDAGHQWADARLLYGSSTVITDWPERRGLARRELVSLHMFQYDRTGFSGKIEQ
jgi:hypothetical protein